MIPSPVDENPSVYSTLREFLEALQATRSIDARGKFIHCLGYLSKLWKDLLSGFSKGKFDLCMICYNGESLKLALSSHARGKGPAAGQPGDLTVV